MLKSFSKLGMFTLNNHIKTSCFRREGCLKIHDVRFFIVLLSIPLPATCLCTVAVFFSHFFAWSFRNVADPERRLCQIQFKLKSLLKNIKNLSNPYIKIKSK